jgi:cytochrome c-type biogenesis protein CcmE
MKAIHLVLIVILVIAVAVVVTTMSDSSIYSDFKEAAKKPGKEFHIIGKLNRVRPPEYDAIKNPGRFSFYLIDEKGTEKRVIYNNSKPRDFEKSEKVVIIGSMKGEDFVATSLLLKCPSKYNDKNNPTQFNEKTYRTGS